MVISPVAAREEHTSMDIVSTGREEATNEENWWLRSRCTAEQVRAGAKLRPSVDSALFAGELSCDSSSAHFRVLSSRHERPIFKS